ncbi:MAG: Ldh family oxidoreductase [Rhodospirillales bacterium]|nr:Ldh family oxidoreductase [Rhodospirillales bacterium]
MSAPTENQRYKADDLTAFAARLLVGAGLAEDISGSVAEALVESELLGHSSHGLTLIRPYATQVEKGLLGNSGRPETVTDRGAVLSIDGNLLPGPWVMQHVIETACQRAPEQGVVSVSVRRSGHIGCQAVYLRRVVERNLAALLVCSVPSSAIVAPYGGTKPLFTTNPIAACWPTDAGPVLFDFSTTITSMRHCRQLYKRGEMLPGPWLLDNQGNPSNDPAVLFGDPPGTLMPVGGVDYGHKGFGLSLLVEMLSSGLAGHGRADAPGGWTTSAFLQVFDPQAFGGIHAFRRETGWLAEVCRAAEAAAWQGPLDSGVHLPGDRALARRAEGLEAGIDLDETTLEDVRDLAAERGVEMPRPID